MIPQKVLNKIKAREPIIYQGSDYNWYSAIVKQPIKGPEEFLGLEVIPTDSRLDNEVRSIADNSGNIYQVSKKVLKGKVVEDEVRRLLESATSKTSMFVVDRVIEQLGIIVNNYQPRNSILDILNKR